MTFYSTDPTIRALAAQAGMDGQDLPIIAPGLFPLKAGTTAATSP